MFNAFAQTAPIAIAISTKSASAVLMCPVNALVGLSSASVDLPIVADAAPSTSSTTHEISTPEARPEPDRPARDVRAQVPRVVRGKRVPADRVPESAAQREQEPAGPARAERSGGTVRRAAARLAEDRDGGKQERQPQHRQRELLERVHHVVPEERNSQLDDDDDRQAQQLSACASTCSERTRRSRC